MAKPHRPVGTDVAYEAWIPKPNKSYSERTVLGTWFHKPTEDQLKSLAGTSYARVRLSEISVILCGQRFYRVYRTPIVLQEELPCVRTQSNSGKTLLSDSENR